MRLILILLLSGFNQVIAQDSLTVNEIHEDMSRGYKPGYHITIPETNAKDIASLWKRQIRSDSKADVFEKKNEIVLPKSILSDISSDTIVMYSKVSAAKSPATGSELTVFVMASDSSFITSSASPSIDSRIKSYLRSFAVNNFRNSIVNQLNIEQKKLNAMKEELRRLERDNENCVKKMNSGKYENAKLQEEITANDDLLDSKKGEIDQQNETVKDMPESDQKIDEQKKLKQLEKEKSRLLEEKESLQKRMEANNGLIEDMQKKLDLNTSSNIPVKTEQIEKQKEIVTNLSKRLNSIR